MDETGRSGGFATTGPLAWFRADVVDGYARVPYDEGTRECQHVIECAVALTRRQRSGWMASRVVPRARPTSNRRTKWAPGAPFSEWDRVNDQLSEDAVPTPHFSQKQRSGADFETEEAADCFGFATLPRACSIVEPNRPLIPTYLR